MLVTWSWWRFVNIGDCISMLVTSFECWCPKRMSKDSGYRRPKWPEPWLTCYSCPQHIWSPTSLTNIDLATNNTARDSCQWVIELDIYAESTKTHHTDDKLECCRLKLAALPTPNCSISFTYPVSMKKLEFKKLIFQIKNEILHDSFRFGHFYKRRRQCKFDCILTEKLWN